MGMDLQSGPKRAVRPSMNVAPLVDVVLVLLIIFMVITPLLTKQMTLSVPAKPDPAEPPPPPSERPPMPQVIVFVDHDGNAKLGNKVIADHELGQMARGAVAARQKAGLDDTVFFDAANDAPFGRALKVLDLVRGAGIAKIAVVPDPLDQ